MAYRSSSTSRRTNPFTAGDHTTSTLLHIRRRISSLCTDLAPFAPLAAALIAPASTLYDIPALTQPWYSLDGVAQPDPRASLILSACSLAASVIANALLVARFLCHAPKIWRLCIILSTAGWILTTILTVANLITFGALTRNAPGYAYEAGFWTAVVSVILAGIVSILLLFHLCFRPNDKPMADIHFNGRTFITSELTLFALIAFEALIFSQIEGWTYLEGIYFTVVSMLSIGFGDFSPTHTSTKVLLFPFEIAGIVLLSNQISLIVGVVRSRVKERRKAWYQKSGEALEDEYQRKWQKKKKQGEDKLLGPDNAKLRRHVKRRHVDLGLAEEADEDTRELRIEIARLHRIASHEAAMSQLLDLLWSAAVLALFWVVGAVMFHFMEGWAIGDAFYFSYVFFLTVGYGDFSPATPVGQVVFIIWALMAVPIMTNFVVTTIQAVVESMSKLLALTAHEKRKERQRIVDRYFESHDKYLSSAYAAFREGRIGYLHEGDAVELSPLPSDLQGSRDNQQQQRPREGRSPSHIEEDEPALQEAQRAKTGMAGRHGAKSHQDGKYALAIQPPRSILGPTSAVKDGGETSSSSEDANQHIRLQTEALEHALSLATYLEAQARALLVEVLPESSPERLLLQADANIQASHLARLDGKVPSWMESLRNSVRHDERMDRVKIYRLTYARLLVAGRRALSLQGESPDTWERRTAGTAHRPDRSPQLARKETGTGGN